MTGLIGAHVDDLLCCGHGNQYEQSICAVKKCLPFGEWQCAQQKVITFCGCEIHQDASGKVTLTQEEYASSIQGIPISPHRQQDTTAEATPAEKRQLRATLGLRSEALLASPPLPKLSHGCCRRWRPRV